MGWRDHRRMHLRLHHAQAIARHGAIERDRGLDRQIMQQSVAIIPPGTTTTVVKRRRTALQFPSVILSRKGGRFVTRTRTDKIPYFLKHPLSPHPPNV